MCVVVAGVALVSTVGLAARPAYLSPAAVVPDGAGRSLFVLESSADQIAVFDLQASRVGKLFRVPCMATGLVLSADGLRLYVTAGGSEGEVRVLDAVTGEALGCVRVGHTPMAPVLAPDGEVLYVCNRFTNDVSIVHLPSLSERIRVPVLREPVAAGLTPDGRRLFVANHLPAGVANADTVAAVVSVIDTGTGEVSASLRLPNGSTGLRGLCVSPDGAHVYVTHILARFQLPTTQLERGWMNTNAFTIIDTAEAEIVNTVLLDDVDKGAANPWGITCTEKGAFICVAHAGTHEISVIDRAALHEKLTRVAQGENVSTVSQIAVEVPNDLSFLVGIRRRHGLKGNGPRGLVAVGTTVYAAEWFTDSLGVIDIAAGEYARARSLALGPRARMTEARRGAMLFNDASLCFQSWQSCASCHPDGRADGLNWDLLNDGMGNPKQTKSLLLSHKTPPVMVTGVRDRAETAVRSGIRYIQFAVRPEADAVAIDEYLKTLDPARSPRLIEGKLSKSARRGKGVYKKAGCAGCHPGPLYTDLRAYDVGLGAGSEKGVQFDTPQLVEIWRTAPYLYDGRAVTMKEVLTTHNAGDTHGHTSHLSPGQLEDLTEFVLSQ